MQGWRLSQIFIFKYSTSKWRLIPKITHLPTHTLLVMSQIGLSALAEPVHSVLPVHPEEKEQKLELSILTKNLYKICPITYFFSFQKVPKKLLIREK